MDARALAISQARGRIAVGAALALVPGLAGRFWVGAEAQRPATKVLARALGVREMAIGLGVVIALDRGAPVRGWIEAGALADVGDLGATLLAGRAIEDRTRRAVALSAAASALAGAALSRALDEPQPPGATEAPESVLTGHPPAQ